MRPLAGKTGGSGGNSLIVFQKEINLKAKFLIQLIAKGFVKGEREGNYNLPVGNGSSSGF